MFRQDFIRVLELHLIEGRIGYYTLQRPRFNTRVEIGVPLPDGGMLAFFAEGTDMNLTIHEVLMDVLDYLRETGVL